MGDVTGCYCGVMPGASPTDVKFAVWLHGRGWLVDVCGHEATVADRLHGATWFSTEYEAQRELDKVEYGVESMGAVVTL